MEGRSTNVAPNLMVNETDKISILNSEFKRYLNVIRTAPRNLIAGQRTVGCGLPHRVITKHSSCPAQPSPAQPIRPGSSTSWQLVAGGGGTVARSGAGYREPDLGSTNV